MTNNKTLVLINLPQYHIYLTLLIDGTQSQPFSATTLPIQAKKHFFKQECVYYSRERYGMKKGNIQQVLPLHEKRYKRVTQKSLF